MVGGAQGGGGAMVVRKLTQINGGENGARWCAAWWWSKVVRCMVVEQGCALRGRGSGTRWWFNVVGELGISRS